MNHYCLLCEHFRKRKWKFVYNGFEGYHNCENMAIDAMACKHFTPRTNKQDYDAGVRVLRMLGVEVEE
jgi:hypothetical protein